MVYQTSTPDKQECGTVDGGLCRRRVETTRNVALKIELQTLAPDDPEHGIQDGPLDAGKDEEAAEADTGRPRTRLQRWKTAEAGARLPRTWRRVERQRQDDGARGRL